MYSLWETNLYIELQVNKNLFESFFFSKFSCEVFYVKEFKQFLEFATSIFFCFKHSKIFFYSALNLHASKNMGIKVNVHMTTCISVI